MPIVYQKLISRHDVLSHPGQLYLFGDNAEGKGMRGQAAVMRGALNARGIPTKMKPSGDEDAFFSDSDLLAWRLVLAQLYNVARDLEGGKIIVVPADGLGTGFAQLPQRAPRLYKLMRDFFTTMPGGDPCPWP